MSPNCVARVFALSIMRSISILKAMVCVASLMLVVSAVRAASPSSRYLPGEKRPDRRLDLRPGRCTRACDLEVPDSWNEDQPNDIASRRRLAAIPLDKRQRHEFLLATQDDHLRHSQWKEFDG